MSLRSQKCVNKLTNPQILMTSLTQPESHLKHKVGDGGIRAKARHEVQDEEGRPAYHEGGEHLQ